MEKKNLQSIDAGGNIVPVELWFRVSDKSSVHYISEDYDSGIIENDVIYFAMEELHRLLDSKGIKLLCNCFRKDVHPSGMSLSMGQGVLAYEMEMGKPGEKLVNIFDTVFLENAGMIGTCEEQDAYQEQWFGSL